MGYVYILSGVLLFGLNGSIAKVVIEAGVTPSQLSFFRALATALLAGLLLLVFHPAGFRLTRKQFGAMLLIGVFGVALIQVAYATAVSLLPVGIALLIQYCGVVIVALVAYFVFREPAKPRLWFALGLVVIGLIAVANISGAPLNPLGLIAAISAAFCLALYFLMSERMLGQTSVLTIAFWPMLFASGVLLVPASPWLMDPSIFFAVQPMGGALDSVSLPIWVPLAWVSVIGTFVTYYLSFLGIRKLKASQAGILSIGEVVFAFLFAWLWLRETLAPVQLIGVITVVVGIAIAQTARKGKIVDVTLATSELQLPPVQHASEVERSPLPERPEADPSRS